MEGAGPVDIITDPDPDPGGPKITDFTEPDPALEHFSSTCITIYV